MSLRILCLNYEYPPVGGGGGRVAHRINAELVRRGHAVRVLTAGMRHLPGRETVDGVEIFRAGKFRKKEDTCTVPEMAHYLAAGFLPAMAQIRNWKPHVIHAHFAVPTGALAFKVSLTGTPYVITAHLGDVPGGVPEETGGLFRVVQPLTRPIWKRAAAITAVSTFVANLAERAYGRRPEVILNGAASIPAPQIEIHDPPKILFIGRLGPQKNPLLAIRALELVRDLDWHLDVIGDGPLAAETKVAAAANLGERVHFHGWRTGTEVAAAMNAADILLMTSVSEGMPMVAVEAIQHGLALVVSRVEGMADVAHENKNALLAELNAESFATRLRSLLAQPELLSRLRRGSLAMAGNFDLTHSADAYERVLSAAARR